MVKIKKVNERSLKLWQDEYGFNGDRVIFAVLQNGSFHFRKCMSGTFCGKDCFDLGTTDFTFIHINDNRDKFCNHCMVYVDELVKRRNSK